jgi:murein DD-endopeptidase MepM/ murein hydrolase activator NlpD
VRSIGSGVVTFVGEVAGTPSVTIEHQRVRSSYQPVRAQVSIGDRVQTGAIIGIVTAPAHCPATCLHLGVRRPVWDARDAESDPYLDPIAWINRTPVLKPLARSLP